MQSLTINTKISNLLDNCIRMYLYGGNARRGEAISKTCQSFELICKSLISGKNNIPLSKIVDQLSDNVLAIKQNKEIIDKIRELRNCHIHEIDETDVSDSTLGDILNVIISLLKEHNLEIKKIVDDKLANELSNKLNGNIDRETTAETNLKAYYYQTHNIDLVKNDTFESNFTDEMCPKCGKCFLYVEDQFIDTDLPYCFYCEEQIDAVECNECPSYKLRSQKCSSCGTE